MSAWDFYKQGFSGLQISITKLEIISREFSVINIPGQVLKNKDFHKQKPTNVEQNGLEWRGN